MAAWCTAWVSAEERETPGIREPKKAFKKEIQAEVEEGHRQRAKTGVAKINSLEEQTSLEMRLLLPRGLRGFPAWVLSLVIPRYCDITASGLIFSKCPSCSNALGFASEKSTVYIWVGAPGETREQWSARRKALLPTGNATELIRRFELLFNVISSESLIEFVIMAD